MKKLFLLFLTCLLGLTGEFDVIKGFAQSDPCIFYNEFMIGVRPRSIMPNSMAFIEKLPGIAPATIDKLREAVEEANASGSPLQRRFELERVVKSDAERFMIRVFFNLNDYESCPEMLDKEILFHKADLIADEDVCPYVIPFQIFNRPDQILAEHMPLIRLLPGYEGDLDTLNAALPIASRSQLESAIGTGPEAFLLRVLFNLGGSVACEHESQVFDTANIEVETDFIKWNLSVQQGIGVILYQFDHDMNLVNTLGVSGLGRTISRNIGGTTGGFIPNGEDGYLHIKAFDADGGVQWWPSKEELFKVERP